MKKRTRIIILVLLILVGVKYIIPNLNLDVSALLENMLKKVDSEQVQEITEGGIEALKEACPQLKPFLSQEGMTDLLTGEGLSMLTEYANGNSALTQAQADTLGTILEAISPEISDSVKSILSEAAIPGILDNLS